MSVPSVEKIHGKDLKEEFDLNRVKEYEEYLKNQKESAQWVFENVPSEVEFALEGPEDPKQFGMYGYAYHRASAYLKRKPNLQDVGDQRIIKVYWLFNESTDWSKVELGYREFAYELYGMGVQKVKESPLNKFKNDLQDAIDVGEGLDLLISLFVPNAKIKIQSKAALAAAKAANKALKLFIVDSISVDMIRKLDLPTSSIFKFNYPLSSDAQLEVMVRFLRELNFKKEDIEKAMGYIKKVSQNQEVLVNRIDKNHREYEKHLKTIEEYLQREADEKAFAQNMQNVKISFQYIGQFGQLVKDHNIQGLAVLGSNAVQMVECIGTLRNSINRFSLGAGLLPAVASAVPAIGAVAGIAMALFSISNMFKKPKGEGADQRIAQMFKQQHFMLSRVLNELHNIKCALVCFDKKLTLFFNAMCERFEYHVRELQGDITGYIQYSIDCLDANIVFMHQDLRTGIETGILQSLNKVCFEITDMKGLGFERMREHEYKKLINELRYWLFVESKKDFFTGFKYLNNKPRDKSQVEKIIQVSNLIPLDDVDVNERLASLIGFFAKNVVNLLHEKDKEFCEKWEDIWKNNKLVNPLVWIKALKSYSEIIKKTRRENSKAISEGWGNQDIKEAVENGKLVLEFFKEVRNHKLFFELLFKNYEKNLELILDYINEVVKMAEEELGNVVDVFESLNGDQGKNLALLQPAVCDNKQVASNIFLSDIGERFKISKEFLILEKLNGAKLVIRFEEIHDGFIFKVFYDQYQLISATYKFSLKIKTYSLEQNILREHMNDQGKLVYAKGRLVYSLDRDSIQIIDENALNDLKKKAINEIRKKLEEARVKIIRKLSASSLGESSRFRELANNLQADYFILRSFLILMGINISKENYFDNEEVIRKLENERWPENRGIRDIKLFMDSGKEFLEEAAGHRKRIFERILHSKGKIESLIDYAIKLSLAENGYLPDIPDIMVSGREPSPEDHKDPKVQKEDFVICDVPGEGACLFYSIIFSTLLPLLDDKKLFKEMYIQMFGGAENKTLEEEIYGIKKLLIEYKERNGDYEFINQKRNKEIFFELTKKLRKQLIEYMKKNKSEFEGFTKGDFEESMLDIGKPNASGDDREIKAASEFLKIHIIVQRNERTLEYGLEFKNAIYLIYEGNGKDGHYKYKILSDYLLDLSRIFDEKSIKEIEHLLKDKHKPFLNEESEFENKDRNSQSSSQEDPKPLPQSTLYRFDSKRNTQKSSDQKSQLMKEQIEDEQLEFDIELEQDSPVKKKQSIVPAKK